MLQIMSFFCGSFPASAENGCSGAAMFRLGRLFFLYSLCSLRFTVQLFQPPRSQKTQSREYLKLNVRDQGWSFPTMFHSRESDFQKLGVTLSLRIFHGNCADYPPGTQVYGCCRSPSQAEKRRKTRLEKKVALLCQHSGFS